MLQKVPYLDGSVFVNPQENIGFHILQSGIYEPNIIQIISDCMAQKFHFVDVGANIGLHTLAAAFASQGDDQSIDAFEPEPGTFDRLKQNCELNHIDQRVILSLHQHGVGAETTEMQLYSFPDDNEGNHSFLGGEGATASRSVPVYPLDQIFKDRPSDLPTLVKIDVEGFEQAVLQGGKAFFARLQNAILIIEVSPDQSENDLGRRPHLLQALDEAGFTQRFIIDDYDSFDLFGDLRNDYFNIVSWKGGGGDRCMLPLAKRVALKHFPGNRPEFVRWQDYSTFPLRPARSADERALIRRRDQIESIVAQLNGKTGLQGFRFDTGNRLVGMLRRAWYSVAAKWGIRHLQSQQSEVNRMLLEIIKSQQAEIDLLNKKLDELA